MISSGSFLTRFSENDPLFSRLFAIESFSLAFVYQSKSGMLDVDLVEVDLCDFEALRFTRAASGARLSLTLGVRGGFLSFAIVFYDPIGSR